MTAVLYIIHAYADQRLARQLAALLVTGAGIEPCCILGSSAPRHDSTRGASFTDDARERLELARVVVVIASPRLYRSVSASGEAAAAWALRKPVISMLVPPLPRLRASLAGLPALQIDRREDLDRLEREVCNAFALPSVPADRWATARDELLANLGHHHRDRSLTGRRARRELRRAFASEADAIYEDLTLELAAVLASVAHDADVASTIARRAGFSPAHLPVFKMALGYWSDVVEQAARGRIDLQALIAEACSQFPFNRELEDVSRRISAATKGTRDRRSPVSRDARAQTTTLIRTNRDTDRPQLADKDAFLARVHDVTEALAPLSTTTREAIFWHLRGAELSHERRPRKRWDDTRGPLAYKEITSGSRPESYVPDPTHPRVGRALDALEELRAWLSTAVQREGFVRWYEGAFPGSVPDVENQVFWDHHLTAQGRVRMLG